MEQTIPKVKREVFVGTHKDGDEVILEGANGTFGSVASMRVGRSKLEIDAFLREEVFQYL